eukprot:617629_1
MAKWLENNITELVLIILALVIVFYYFINVAHTPKLISSNRLSKEVHQWMVKCNSSLNKTYYPFILWNAHLQLIFITLKSMLCAKTLPWKTEAFELKDGQRINVDWLHPEPDSDTNPSQTPLVIINHTIGGDSTGLVEVTIAEALHQRHYRVLVLNRRGHSAASGVKLTVPHFDIFGNASDIREVFDYAIDKYKPLGVIFIGISAGTAPFTRFISEEVCGISDGKHEGRLKKMICGIGFCPMFNLKHGFKYIPKLYDAKMLNYLKGLFFNDSNMRLFKSSHSSEQIQTVIDTDTLHEFIVASSSLLKYSKDYDGMISRSHPTLPQFFGPDDEHVPVLLFNSRDDPICNQSMNYDIKQDEIKLRSNTLLVFTKHGSHCCFLSLFGGFYFIDIVVNWINAAVQTKRSQQDVSKTTLLLY